MTIKADSGLILGQKVAVIGTVRHVAYPATLVQHNFMDNLFLEYFFLVALVARLVSRGVEQVFPFGGMGIVAGRAFTPLDGRMHPGLVQPYLLAGMATQAELVSLFLEEQFRHNSMA